MKKVEKEKDDRKIITKLLFLEALYIKNLAPQINDGLKATYELILCR